MKKKGQSGKDQQGGSQKVHRKSTEPGVVRASTAEDFGPDVIRARWWPARPLEDGARSPGNKGEEGQAYRP